MYLKYFFIMLGIHLATVTSKHVRFYRRDYTYVSEYDAFYKLHVDNNTSWKAAFLTCDNEEAKLFYPTDSDEWRIVMKLKEGMAVSANVTDVLIGVHNQFNVGEFVTVDGHQPPVPMGDELQRVEEGEACVIMDSTTGSYAKGLCTRSSPTIFVCKKLDNEPCLTTSCPTIDSDYKYSSELKKCYKVNKNPKSWQEAMQKCYMEGGLLTAAEDTTQVNKIRNFLDLNQYTTYFIGVRDLFNDGKYYTVEGKNIGAIQQRANQLSKYSHHTIHRWQSVNKRTDTYNSAQSELETDAGPTLADEFGCGVLTYETIEAAACYNEMPFICEMRASN